MIEAVVFDLDGVIADTEKYHTEAKKQILSANGISLGSEEIENRFAGVSSEKMFQELFDSHDVEGKPAKAAEEKRRKYRELVAGEVKPVEGVKELVKDVSESFQTGIASSSPYDNIRRVLEKTGLSEFFEVAVSAKEDGLDGKPQPDVYLEAARRLSVEPTNCIAIEDGVKGIKSAKTAGMTVVAIRDEKDGVDPDYLTEDLRELNADKLRKISE